MRSIALQSVLVLCPFILNAASEKQDTNDYFLEKEDVSNKNYFALESKSRSVSVSSTDTKNNQSSTDVCNSFNHRMHVGARHTEARGVGYHSGYTTLEGFFNIYDKNNHFIPFVDLRGHVFNDGTFAGNVGIGERTALTSIQHLLGLYLYYDVRGERHGLTVNQLSPGIELLGSRMEYRMNGYFPVGNTESRKYNRHFSHFHDHHIILKTKQRRALTGGDAEVGVHMTQSPKYDLYLGAGPYYFTAKHASSWGGKARLVGRYKEYITLEATYTYDHLFRGILQGTVAFNLPFGGKLKRRVPNCAQENNLWFSRAAFSPYRFEIPVVKKTKHHSKAINPATGHPWKVWFVNNTSHSSGTYESPFPTLLQAQNASSPNQMIYVFPGNGTTSGMDQGIDLQNGQLFFGSGTTQHFRTTKGNMTIPRFSHAMPKITNVAGMRVVDARSNNVISGFDITAVPGGATYDAIVASAKTPNNRNFTAINNVFKGQIRFNGEGKVNISNNEGAPGSALLTGSSIFLVGASNSHVKGKIANNTLGGGDIPITVVNADDANPARFNFSIENNEITGGFATHGMLLGVFGTDSKFNVTNNTVVNDLGRNGIIFTSASNKQNGKITVNNNTVYMTSHIVPVIGLAIGEIDSVDNSSNDKVIVRDNQVIFGPGNVSDGIRWETPDTLCLTMDNNTVTGSSGAQSDYKLVTTNADATIFVDSLDNNIGRNVTISGPGTVNFVAEGTCSN